MELSVEPYLQISNAILKQKSANFHESTHQPTIGTINVQNVPCIWLKYDSIQSTMIPAEHWPQQLTENTTFAFQAISQTQGKGQGTNTWTSPPGNIYLTILTRIKPNLSTLLSIIACSAVLKTLLQQFPDVKTQCKWINDVFIAEKKVAGLLTSCSISGQKFIANIGVGLNLMAAPLEGSTCLAKHTNVPIDINRICESLIRNILQGLQDKDQSMNLYQKSLMFRGQKVKIMDKQLQSILEQGVFKGINEFGHAIIQKEEKEVIVHSGRMREYNFPSQPKQPDNREEKIGSKSNRSQHLL